MVSGQGGDEMLMETIMVLAAVDVAIVAALVPGHLERGGGVCYESVSNFVFSLIVVVQINDRDFQQQDSSIYVMGVEPKGNRQGRQGDTQLGRD